MSAQAKGAVVGNRETVALVAVLAVRAGDMLMTANGLFVIEEIEVDWDTVVLKNAEHGDLRAGEDAVVGIVKDKRQLSFLPLAKGVTYAT